METPTSDFESNGSIPPSEPSEPTTPLEPFEPKFKVKVADPVKDGEAVKYTVKTTTEDREKGDEYKVIRQYEDFEWLHHRLLANNDIMGIIGVTIARTPDSGDTDHDITPEGDGCSDIPRGRRPRGISLHPISRGCDIMIPPLPPKPVVEAKGAETKSKKTLGTESKILIGDEFHKDCRALEKYMQLMINHWVFGKDQYLHKFLTEVDAPVRTKLKKTLFGRLSSALEESKKVNHKDIDDYFQKERDTAHTYSLLMHRLSSDFDGMVNKQQRIACVYGHLATALNLGSSAGLDDEAKVCNKILLKLSEALEDAKHGGEVDVANDENTLGFQLNLAMRYSDSLKEMHYRRTCLLVNYEDANKALAKAKPNKQQEAEENKRAAERAYEECTETARREIVAFQRQRLLALQEALCLYTEAKVKTARDTYALLAKSLTTLKQMDIEC